MPPIKDVRAYITQVLSAFSSQKDIKPAHHLTRDLELDSVDIMDALQQVEDEYGLVIPTDILPRLQSVEDLVQEVERRANGLSGGPR